MSFKKIADTILAASPADQTEIVYRLRDESLTRFANNHIHQNVTETNHEIWCVAFPVPAAVSLFPIRLILRAFENSHVSPSTWQSSNLRIRTSRVCLPRLRS